MSELFRKNKKFIVILVIIALLIPIGITSGIGFTSGDDMRIASEISNMTGVEIERILELRSIGRTWDDILKKLQSNKDNQNQKSDRNNTILQTSVGEEYIDELKKEGYTENEIMEAKMFVERVIFQLNELTQDSEVANMMPQAGIIENNDFENEDISSYIDLQNQIDLKTAVYLMLKLKDEFGSIEKVLDEYLYAIQVGLNLEDYLVDKEKYLEQKEQKNKELNVEEIITLNIIEERLLEKIQNQNEDNYNDTETNIEQDFCDIETEVQSPEIPNPSIEDIKPENPVNEIMEEIQIINPN